MVYILSALPTRNINLQSFYLSLITCFWFVFFQRIDKGSSTLYTLWVHFRTFLCTCFAHRFHRQALPFRCSIFKVRCASASQRRLAYYITLFFVCQYFFESFFNFFLDLAARSSFNSLAQSACILYILLSLLSIPFLKFFQDFLDFFSFFKTSCFLRKIVYNRC